MNYTQICKVLAAAAVCVMGTTASVGAEELQELDRREVAGCYCYSADDASNMLVIMPQGDCYELVDYQLQTCSFEVYGTKDDFLLVSDDHSMTYLHKQTEKEPQVYYAMYRNYLGNAEEIESNEGKQVRLGDEIFDNNYVVGTKEGLTLFYSDEPTEAAKIGKVEGNGYDSPEAAAEAFMQGLKNRDFSQMKEAFAVESYAQHYDAEKGIELYPTFSAGYTMVPGSTQFAEEINTLQREGAVDQSLNYLYGNLNGYMRPLLDGGWLRMEKEETIYSFEKRTGLYRETPWEINSYEVNCPFPEKIVAIMKSEGYSEAVASYYGPLDPDDVKSVCVHLLVDSEEYYLLLETICWDGNWFIVNLGGTVMLRFSSPLAAGLVSLDELKEAETETVSEPACEVVTEAVSETVEESAVEIVSDWETEAESE